MQTCRVCSSLVADEDTHLAWHQTVTEPELGFDFASAVQEWLCSLDAEQLTKDALNKTSGRVPVGQAILDTLAELAGELR
jgi:hypothetical protein